MPVGTFRSFDAAVMGRSRQRHPTRGLTEGAILAALTAIVGGASLIVPPAAVLIAPLPIMLVVIRWGVRTAVLTSIVAALILLQLFGPLNAVSVTAMFAPLGLALGWGVRRGIGAQLAVLSGAAAFLASMLAAVTAITFVLHQDLLGQFIQSQVKAWQTALDLQQRFGAPAQQVEETRKMIGLLPHFLTTALPVGLALGALVWAYLCYALARNVLRRVGHDLPGVPPILAWRIPPVLASALVWAAAGVSLASLRVSWMAGAALDAVLVNVFVFGFQGLLVAITWANRRQIPRFLQVIAALLMLRAGTLPVLALTILGMLDTWFDYRRLTGRPGSPASGAASDSHDGARAVPVEPGDEGDGSASPHEREALKVVHPR